MHKFANGDLISKLADVWHEERFFIHKVKSHRKLESATDKDDLWCIAGNMCADSAATAAYMSVPKEIRDLADDIVTHTENESRMLREHLQFLCQLNVARCKCIDDKKREDGLSTLLHPRQPGQENAGLFRSDLMGQEALDVMIAFAPPEYVTRPVVHCADEKFHPCLQRANIAKAFKLWADLLKWPEDLQPDYDPVQHGDVGISWFELFTSFYLSTGWRCPIRISDAGAQSKYIGYGDPEAIALPDAKCKEDGVLTDFMFQKFAAERWYDLTV